MGIVHMAVTPADRWETDPLVSARIGPGHRPKDLMPDARSVIVIGVPIQRTILETAPSIYYNHLYTVVNNLLDQATERLALELNISGYNAVYIPRDGYSGLQGLKDKPESFFSHRHAAYLAGFGTFGWNNMLLNPEYGPRMRYASVVTEAELPYSDVMTADVCIRCGRCTRSCPAHAVGDDDYPKAITLKDRCTAEEERLKNLGRMPCGICIKVCPIGNDSIKGPTDQAIDTVRRYGLPPKQ